MDANYRELPELEACVNCDHWGIDYADGGYWCDKWIAPEAATGGGICDKFTAEWYKD